LIVARRFRLTKRRNR